MPIAGAVVEQLCRTNPLTEAQAAKVAEELVALWGETVEQYVRRRHAELQAGGCRNLEIFERVADELENRLVKPPALSARQLRRIVYG